MNQHVRSCDAGSSAAFYKTVAAAWAGKPGADARLTDAAAHLALPDSFVWQDSPASVLSLSSAKVGSFLDAFFRASTGRPTEDPGVLAKQLLNIFNMRKQQLRTASAESPESAAASVARHTRAISSAVTRSYGEALQGRQSPLAVRYITEQLRMLRTSLGGTHEGQAGHPHGDDASDDSSCGSGPTLDTPFLLRAMLYPHDAVLLVAALLLGGVARRGCAAGGAVEQGGEEEEGDIGPPEDVKALWRSGSEVLPAEGSEARVAVRQSHLTALQSLGLVHTSASEAAAAAGAPAGARFAVGSCFNPMHPVTPTSWTFFSSQSLAGPALAGLRTYLCADCPPQSVDSMLEAALGAKVVDLKYDGERLLLHRTTQAAGDGRRQYAYKFFSRNMFEVPSRKVPDAMVAALDEVLSPDVDEVVLDAEILSKHTRGSRSHLPVAVTFESPALFVFDVLQLNGYSLLAAPLVLRRALLRCLVLPDPRRHAVEVAGSAVLGCTACIGAAPPPALHRLKQGVDYMVRRQIEGVVVKPLLSPYMLGNKGLWKKVKRNYLDLPDCPVGATTPHEKLDKALDRRAIAALACNCEKCNAIRLLESSLDALLQKPADLGTPRPAPDAGKKRKRRDPQQEALAESVDLCIIAAKPPAKAGGVPEQLILGTFAQAPGDESSPEGGGAPKLVAAAELCAPYPAALAQDLARLFLKAKPKLGGGLPRCLSLPPAIATARVGSYVYLRALEADSCFVLQVNGPGLGLEGGPLPRVAVERLRPDKAAFSSLTTLKEMRQLRDMQQKRR